MATKGYKHEQSIASDEHDMVEYRKRVSLAVDGNSVAYEDTSFTSGDSPLVCDVFSDLGRIGHQGYICNDGSGKLLVEFSADGSSYGGQHTLTAGEELRFEHLTVRKIRLTYVTPTAYRVLVA